jgi:peptidoglycan hydrolase CwlO-like protein
VATPSQNDAISIQLLEMLRNLDSKVSEVNERTIRIEAQEFGKQVDDLNRKFEEEKKERINLQLSLERIQTKIAPLLLIVSTAGSSGLTLLVNNWLN